MALIINEFSYDGGGGDFIEIRAEAGEPVTGFVVETYTKSGNVATLEQTLVLPTGFTKTTVGGFDYYVVNIPLDDGPRAAITLVDTATNTNIGTVAWGGPAGKGIDLTGGAAGSATVTSIGDPLGNNTTHALTNDGSGVWEAGTWTADNPPSPGSPVCFCSGSLIETADGPVPVEALREGDAVLTTTGWARLRLATMRQIGPKDLRRNKKLCPVVIEPGALGAGLPRRRLCVSRQHRLVVNSKIATRLFGGAVFVPAHKLVGLPGIWLDETCLTAQYHHLLFEDHRVIFAEGAMAESLLLAPQALASLDGLIEDHAHAALMRQAATAPMAAALPIAAKGKAYDQLRQRHLRNRQHGLQRPALDVAAF